MQRFVFLFLLGLFTALNVSAQVGVDSIYSLIKQINKSGSVDSLKWGFCLIDSTGKKLVNYNSEKRLTPASIVKTLTTSIALETLPASFTLKTQLAYCGKIDTLGVLTGDIYIIGGGDPTFASERFNANYLTVIDSWVLKMKSLGLKQINGNIIVDNSYFPDPKINSKWDADDYGSYYGASPTGFMFNENSYRIQFNKGRKGDTATIKRIEPIPYNCKLINEVVYKGKNTEDRVVIYSKPNDSVIRITGSIPELIDNFSVRGALPNPELSFASVLKNVMTMSGIQFSGQLKCGSDVTNKKLDYKVIDEVTSPSLFEIVNNTNLYSINLYAESILRHLGKLEFGIASTSCGVAKIKSEFSKAGIDSSRVYLFDGSGLSRSDSICPLQFAQFVNYIRSYKTNSLFVHSLPIAGYNCDVKNILKEPENRNRVFLKTGYMNKVRTFVGYVDTNTKGRLSFCIIFNDYLCTTPQVKLLAEVLLKVVILQ